MWLSHAQNWYTEERIFFVDAQAGTKESGKFTGKEMIFPTQLQIIAGSTMPTSRLQQREEAKELHKEGAIDIRELLERIDWPNRAEVINRMEMGMLGPIIKRMQALQVDPKIIEMLQKIASMDESEYNAVVNQMKEAQHNQMQGGIRGKPEQVKGL
jgi:precorrin-4 methylase